VSHEVIVNLIANTTTRSGPLVRAALDNNAYPKGVTVSDEEFARIRLERASFHGEWNYRIKPN
jgi:Rhodopirellula transposase DDE domain